MSSSRSARRAINQQLIGKNRQLMSSSGNPATRPRFLACSKVSALRFSASDFTVPGSGTPEGVADRSRRESLPVRPDQRWRYHRPGNAAGPGVASVANSAESDEAIEQGDAADKAKHIGALQLIPGVRRT